VLARQRLLFAVALFGVAGCGLVTSLDDLHGDASVDASSEGSSDAAIPTGSLGGDCFANATCNAGLTCKNGKCISGAGDAAPDGLVPGILCGSSQCNALTQLCCTDGVTAFCTQTCAGPSWAFGCDDTRQCMAKHDGGSNWACCLQALDSGSNAATLCGSGCARTVCNTTAPDCPNGLSCTGLETVDNYPVHFCQ
jgi:hypothetical protein